MNNSRFLKVSAVGLSLVLGLVTIGGLAEKTSSFKAWDSSKNFTINAANCTPSGNKQYTSVVTGISSDIETYIDLTNGGTLTYGGSYIFQDQGGLGKQPTGDFYVGVNNITAFTIVYSATGLSEGYEGYPVMEASLYKETLGAGLGTPTTIDLKDQSGIEQTVSGSGYRTLRFHFNDWYLSARFALTSVNVSWNC